MKSYQQLFAELKRRHVFRVMAVYGAVAFGLIQVADPLVKALLLPDVFLTYIVVVLLLGFPVAVVFAWAFEVTPDGVRRAEAATPDELATIVAEPAAKRWTSGLMALAGLTALLGGVWWTGLQMGRSTLAETPPNAGVESEGRAASLQLATSVIDDRRPSIAVLPFADMSAEGDQEYFSDGMTEEIFSTLANVRDLRVSGRTSAFAYKGTDKDLREIAAELGVAYLVEGSVRKAGDQLRITAVLVEAENGARLWSDTFDREFADIFAIQTEIAEAVAGALTVPLGLEGDETLARTPTDLDAYDLYLAARAAIRDRGARLVDAVRLLETAIGRDSAWAPAWAALAEATELTIWYPSAIPTDVAPVDYIPGAIDAAERAARRALVLDSRDASAQVALGSVLRDRGQWEEAETAYRRALTLDPDSPEAHNQFAEYLLNVGRIAEAVQILDRAALLDPSPNRLSMLAYGLRADGRWQEAAELLEYVVTQPMPAELERLRYLQLATQYQLLGRWDDAILAVDRANEAGGGVDVFVETRKEIVRAVRAGDPSQVPEDAVDRVTPIQWVLLERPERAATGTLDFLTTRSPFGRVVELWFPSLEPIRSDPRVVDYLAERGFSGDEAERTPPEERTRPVALRTLGS